MICSCGVGGNSFECQGMQGVTAATMSERTKTKIFLLSCTCTQDVSIKKPGIHSVTKVLF